MEVWSRKHVHYSILKVIKSYLIDQIKLNELDGKVMNCVFNVYPRMRMV